MDRRPHAFARAVCVTLRGPVYNGGSVCFRVRARDRVRRSRHRSLLQTLRGQLRTEKPRGGRRQQRPSRNTRRRTSTQKHESWRC